MARPNKLWWWESKGEYAVNIRGQRYRLGTDCQEAHRLMHEPLARPAQGKADPQMVVGLWTPSPNGCDKPGLTR